MSVDSPLDSSGFTVKLAWAGPVLGEDTRVLDALREHESVTLRELATTGAETVKIIRSGSVDAIVTPLLWADLTRAIRVSSGLATGGPTSLIAVADAMSPPILVKALVSGFDGIVATSAGVDQMIIRIKQIIDGRLLINDDPALQSLGVSAGLFTRQIVIDDPVDQHIADLVGTGMPDDDIARIMDIPVQAVRNRIEGLLVANGLTYRTQLAVIQASLVKVPDFA